MSKVVAIVGTLDTKGAEFEFLKNQIESHGVGTLVINAGFLGEPPFTPDVSSREVTEAAGEDLDMLIKEADRGHSVAAMCNGVSVIAADLYRKGRFNGIISMGGGAGTTIGSAAMRVLPIGVPKLIVSTVASGNVQPYVDIKDITMMPAITDISGLNRISRKIIANAAGAIAGMVKVASKPYAEDKPVIGASMFGVTTPCITHARELLEAKGYEVLVFHASGTGGRTLEDLIRSGMIQGVLDITTHELADELVGGVRNAGPDRLEAAGKMGIPQVVSAGALDMINFGPPETVPVKFKDRRFYPHTPKTTLMRSTKEENSELGRIVANKLNRAKGPTTFMIPQKGFSMMDKQGQPFYDPEADNAFITSLKENLSHRINLVEMDTDINDPVFAEKAVAILLKYLK
ncbi:Tm-1-like ATP-binding domain-containing protein [Chloroflexota bacterium]